MVRHMKDKKESVFKRFYNELLDLSTVFKNGDGKKKLSIIGDLLFLVLITCILKIPFIFVRDLGDNLIETMINGNMAVLSIWGLALELIYAVVALSFFFKTFEKWMKNLK